MNVAEVKNQLEIELSQGISRDVLFLTKVTLDGGGQLKSSIIITDEIGNISGGNSVVACKFDKKAKLKVYSSLGVIVFLKAIDGEIRSETWENYPDASIVFEDDKFLITQRGVTDSIEKSYSDNTLYYIEYEALPLDYLPSSDDNRQMGTVSVCTIQLP